MLKKFLLLIVIILITLSLEVKVTPTVAAKTGNTYTEKVDGVSIEMVHIKGGTFNMGSNNGESNEKPIHSVTVSSFYMGKYEVTNREYMIYDPKHKGCWSEKNYPVECISWDDAVGYCKWLSKKTGKSYRLPTEAEWEYACRGGTTTEYYWGDDMDGSYCWYCSNSDSKLHPVGEKLPNPYGLYDMNGNVWEWCSDWYGENYYSHSSSTNPQGPSSGSGRVWRGGCCYNYDHYCRSGIRYFYSPGYRNGYLGFRLVMKP